MKKVLFLIFLIIILLGGFWYRAEASKCPDTDGDGLNDCKEDTIYFTEKFGPDTDGDGYLDGKEVSAGYSPTQARPIKFNELDSDQDGVFDDREIKLGTALNRFDSDGDGLNDQLEIDNGSDPLDVNSKEKEKHWYQFYK